MELAGKRALVTGAGRGIGRAIALALAAAGAEVALLARSAGELRETATLIGELGQKALVFTADLAAVGEVDTALDKVMAALGGIDILVNNAGIQGPIGKMHEVPAADWWKVVEVNLGGCFLCTRRVLPGMIERQYGKIINLSGGGAVGTRPFFSAYSASKAAVVRLTETLAAEVAEYHIDVNAIAPGAVNTRMLDERLAVGEQAGSAEIEADRKLIENGGTDPQRPAALVVYLASPRSDGLSGRLLAAVWDPWEELDIAAVMASEAYTVRRLKMEE
jgi:NAD(P)-dependent dehydrogenase (short-subunit alcohol dehydrogenase family)